MCGAFIVNYNPEYYHSFETHEQTLPCFIAERGNGVDAKIIKMLQNKVTASKVEDIIRSYVFNMRTKRKAAFMSKDVSIS